jgi:hypothetical protein
MKYPRRLRFTGMLFIAFSCLGYAKDTKPGQPPPISKDTRLAIIRLLHAEFAWTRKPFPMGDHGLTIKPDGQITPDDANLKQLVEMKGQAAKAGERVQITNVAFKGNDIVLEINGGAKKKTKWYQHIQVGVGGATAQAPQNDEVAKGSYLALEFKDYIPEVTLQDLKTRMAPVFDFSVKSSAQAYVETLPENVRKAITDHQALVGMNKEMVAESMGRPPQRIRDKDEQNRSYEEWIFGEPPQDVQFIRFVGDEVIQVKIMKVDGEKIVRTQREVQLNDPAVAAAKPAAPPRPTSAPTLRRPGEELPAGDPNGIQTRLPTAQPPARDPDPIPKLQHGPPSK